MKSFLESGRVIILVTLVAMLMVSCSPGNLFPSPTPPPTASPTLTPTSTSTPFPTPTETLAPTPTKELTLEQQHERDYGALVPRGETCVKYPELYMNGSEIFPTGVAFAELKVHATGNIKVEKIPMGRDKDKVEREVTMLQVVCRDNNSNIVKPMWLVLGGKDFGEKKDGKNIFFLGMPDGGIGRWPTTIDVILQNILVGVEIRVAVPVNLGSTQPNNLRDRFYSGEGTSNEVVNEALRQFDKNEKQLKLIVDGTGPTEGDFILIPLMITIGPFKSP